VGTAFKPGESIASKTFTNWWDDKRRRARNNETISHYETLFSKNENANSPKKKFRKESL